MLPDEQKVHELELKVGLLGKDVEQTDRLCEKLSESIAKIQELNVNIMQMITLHEQRHEQHEKVETDLKAEIEKYKWMILGGTLALGWLIGNVDLTMLGKLLK